MNLYDMPNSVRALLLQINSEESWPVPEPLLQPLAPVPRLTPQMLPKVLADVTFDEAERMSCPPDFIAAPLVVALGSVIGASAAVRPKRHDHWLVVPNAWGAVIGPPGAKKSAAISAGVRNVFRMNNQAQETHRSAAAAAEFQKRTTDAEIKALERKIKLAAAQMKKTGSSTSTPPNGGQLQLEKLEERLQQQHAKSFDVEPAKRYYTNDATTESIGVLASKNPRGILVMQDELMSLLASFEKPGRETDRQAYLTGWNGDTPLEIDRIGRGHIYIPNFCLSVIGGIQPDVFQSYMAIAGSGNSNDGLIQRLQVMVMPDPVSQLVVVDKSPDVTAAGALSRVFDYLDLGQYLHHARSDIHDRPPYFVFDDGAQSLFLDWLQRHSQKVLDMGSDMLAQHLNKYPKLVPALALIFHLVEVAHAGIKTPGPIGLPTLRLAIGFAEYLEAHAVRIYNLAASAKLRSAHELAKKIQSQELTGPITVRGVQRKGWSGLAEKESLDSAFAELEAACWIRKSAAERTTSAGGRPPAPKFEINPKIFEMVMPGVELTKPTKPRSRRKRA